MKKEIYHLTDEFRKELTAFPVRSEKDYRKLVSKVVLEYLSHGYVLLPDNVSRSGHIEHLRLQKGNTNVVIRTFTKDARRDDTSMFRDVDMVGMIIEENGTLVYERTFYPYRTQHKHNINSCDVRYCASLEEWDALEDKRDKRFWLHCDDNETKVVLSAQRTPHWKDIAKKVLPMVRANRGYSKTPLSAIERIEFSSGESGIRTSVDSVSLNVTIAVHGRDNIQKTYFGYAPSYRKDVRETKNRDDRICIHGVYMPKQYTQRESRYFYRTRQLFPMVDAASHTRIGFVVTAPHPVFGVTYMFTDLTGRAVANGYIPVEDNFGCLLNKETISGQDTSPAIALLARQYAARSLPEEMKKAVITSEVVFYSNADIPMNLGIMFFRNLNERYRLYDLAAINIREWNEAKCLKIEADGTAKVCGTTFRVTNVMLDDESDRWSVTMRLDEETSERCVSELGFSVKRLHPNTGYVRSDNDWFCLSKSEIDELLRYVKLTSTELL